MKNESISIGTLTLLSSNTYKNVHNLNKLTHPLPTFKLGQASTARSNPDRPRTTWSRFKAQVRLLPEVLFGWSLRAYRGTSTGQLVNSSSPVRKWVVDTLKGRKDSFRIFKVCSISRSSNNYISSLTDNIFYVKLRMYLIDVTRWIIEIECYAELQVEITLGILVSKVLDLSQLILSRMIDQLTYAPINGRTNIYKFKCNWRWPRPIRWLHARLLRAGCRRHQKKETRVNRRWEGWGQRPSIPDDDERK